jgi:energy-coupling factor transporter ATP-binding protein EcfA2
MDIRVTAEDRALTVFDWRDVPNLVVLTGKNGVGKSQLLFRLQQHFVNRQHSTVRVDGFTASQQEVVYRSSEWSLSNPNSLDFAQIQSRWREIEGRYRHFATPGVGQHPNPVEAAAFTKAEQHHGVPKGMLTADQLITSLSFADLFQTRDILAGEISELYMEYRSRQVDASLGVESTPLERPPWDLLDRLLEESDLPFKLTNPGKSSVRAPFALKLLSRDTGHEIALDAISSGEKVILSTIFWLFAAGIARLPRFVILDEPDAHLHPSMVRQFMNFFANVLVNRHGVRVIMTTHSPTTVALSPEDAVFVMHPRTSSPNLGRVLKSTRDEAIGVLTAGLPTLRIHHQNRRQVFVESQYDADNYQALFEIVKAMTDPQISLAFVASGVAKSIETGNCDRVKFFVDELTAHGVDTVAGIVDWDGTRTGTATLLVLGDGERYTFENFVFDPLAVAALLLRERICQPAELGLAATATHMIVVEMPDSERQALVNRVLDAIKPKLHPNEIARSETRAVSTTSGMSYVLPLWFCELKGHRLEEKLGESFPGLLRWGNPSNALKAAMIDRVFRDLPQLVPAAVLNTFRAVQTRCPARN